MIARIADSTRFDTIAGNISYIQDSTRSATEQLSTQKKINQPSDDPEGAMTVLNLRTAGAAIDQYQQNIMRGDTWLKMTELNLSGINDILMQAEGVAQNAGESYADRSAAADSLQNIGTQLLSFANAQLDGRYIFSGSKTDTMPFPDMTSDYQGDSGSLLINIGQNSSARYNITGNAIFPVAASDPTSTSPEVGVALFKALDDLKTVLADVSSSDTDVSDAIAKFKTASQNVQQQVQDNITKTSVMLSNLEFADNHLTYLKNQVVSMLAKTEDADTTQLAMELQMQALALNASYTVAAKISESSILNFLQ